jgi:hypothetical protein
MAIAGTMVVESLASEGMVSEKVMVVGSPEPEGMTLVSGTAAEQSESEHITFVKVMVVELSEVESPDPEDMMPVRGMVVESFEGLMPVRGMAAGQSESEHITSVRVMVVGLPEPEGLLPVSGTAAGQSESEGMVSSAVHHSAHSSLSLVGARHSSFDNTCVLSFQLDEMREDGGYGGYRLFPFPTNISAAGR